TYLGLSVLEALCCVFITERICGEFTFFRFLLAGVICILLPACCNVLLFFKTRTFGDMLEFLRKYAGHAKKQA
ncbi:MAG: hypothetical protein J6Z22_05230, partial [Lachnospiraceae bacterium]|nr:hypothetical protein [Lachnospiraceae bacterium]